MPAKTWKKILEMTDDVLHEHAEDLQRDLFKYRFQKTLGQLDKPHLMLQARRDYARIQTLLGQRSRQQGGGEKKS